MRIFYKSALVMTQVLLIGPALAHQDECEPMPASIVSFEYVKTTESGGALHLSVPASVSGAKFVEVDVSADRKYFFHLSTETDGSRVTWSMGLPFHHGELRFDLTYEDLKRRCIRLLSVTFEDGKRID